MEVERLAGTFVAEIGYRGAWPVLVFCDNRPTPAVEARLYIDATWTIGEVSGTADDDVAWLTAALALHDRTVEEALVDDTGALHVRTDSGAVLVVSGEAEAYTVGEPWRLTGWR
ncbi:hypothetical protein GCM10010168_76920 [Actinoplanes ianthinogenes]|uniref:Uncharacterized protein n=1 Tax=Actinoplanes ianthinogenes TaxID=122358 RepID=A0ABN6CTB0_9ACTN|nr:DUF6188 family protein [Actinoplanes ianthinogenes]BCJ48382.1 hypothetical protein Aiant_90390 [Actinoplanes ianthinogenes]GGR46762.1 hypothetical protein GCM10010168_76920 [Actinoplanes ianthinogenes]